jgi:alkylated DNA repair dioxygenase AlkB
MQTITRLRDGALIVYDPAFLPPAEADALLAGLRDRTAWERLTIRGHAVPRLTAFVADEGVDYAYSGVVHRGTGWTPELKAIKDRVEAATAAAGVAKAGFNSLLLNRYRDGRDSIGMHADDEPELGADPVVASVSLGAVRRFVLRHRDADPADPSDRREWPLAHGSLLVMAGACQTFWRHGVPKTAAPVVERINLTFRKILAPPGGRA